MIDRYNVLDEEDIQGEEDGTSGMDGDVKVHRLNNIKQIQIKIRIRFVCDSDNAIQYERGIRRGSFRW